MSHKIAKHHTPRQERIHQENITHREKKDHQRIMYSDSIILHQEKFDRNRDALLGSKKQNRLTQKVKAEEAAIAGAKSGRVKK